jgi:hypothetical protein
VIDVYNVTNGMWRTLTLSESRGGLTSTSLNDLIFFAGGEVSIGCQTASQVIDVFNVTNENHWTFNLSVSGCYPSSTTSQDLVLIGGGGNNGISFEIVDVYNVTSNIWFTLNLSQSRFQLASTSCGNQIFFGGGSNWTHTLDIVDIFAIVSISIPISQSIPITFNSSLTPFTNVTIGKHSFLLFMMLNVLMRD